MDAVAVVDEVVGDHCELAALQVWASGGGNGSEVERFIDVALGLGDVESVRMVERFIDAALGDVESVRTVARGKEIQNEAVVRHLKEIGHVASLLDDLRSELHCYRIPEPDEMNSEERTKDDGDDDQLIKSDATGSCCYEVATEDSAFSTQDSSSTDLQIVPFANSVIPASNTSLQESRRVISREISKQILACYMGAKNLREALEHEKLAYHQSTRTDTRETTLHPTETKVYGRDEERNLIISKLTSTEEEEEEEEESCTGQNLAVIAIVGHGGVGKTTLAKLVFNHPAVSKHFDARLWVYVSSYFDQYKIMRELLESLLRDSHDENIRELNDLQGKLAYALKHKRVLLVLDDMWEDSQKEKWVELLAPLLSNGVEGNRIVITTRKTSVLELTGAKQHINLEGLKKNDFWDLFTECAFGVVGGEKNYPKLKRIGQKIVPRLKGNPLAAKCVGRALSRKLEFGHWTKVLDNSEWKLYQENDSDIMPCLMVSYKHLPVHLQQCFSYCAVFPKYHRYEKECLVSMWIAQGLISSTSTDMRLEDIGSEFFSDLVDLGFLETQVGIARLLVMHDLMHDLAQSISRDETFSIENNSQLRGAAPPPSPLVRHVSLITRSGYEAQLDGTVRPINEHYLREFSGCFGELQRMKLRTLMLFGPHDLHFATTFRREFNEVKSVRVLKLDMVVLCLGSMVGNISQLINLRYMELDCFYRGSTLELPEAICGLRNLQVLDIRNWGDTTVLPRGMNQLVNLRHFLAREALHAKISGIENMTSLQELKAFGVREASSGEFSISQLGKLNQLRGSLWIYNLYDVGSEDKAMEAKICDKAHLASLHLSWHGVHGDKVGTPNKLPLLEVLRPHANLLNLRIEAYSRPAPSWLLSSSSSHLTSLRSLYLDNCLRWRTIPHPDQFPQLRELHLINMGLDKIEIGCLEVLELSNLQRLSQCIVLDKKLSKNLQLLEVVGCPLLRELPLQASISTDDMQGECCQFTCLRKLRAHGYFGRISAFKLLSINSLEQIDLKVLPGDPLCLQPEFKEFELQPRGPSYDGLCMSMKGNRGVSAMAERLFQFKKLCNLLDFEITDYPDLTYLAWEGFQQLTSLKTFKMMRCHKLFSGSVELTLPPSVRELEFHSCDITGRQLALLLLNPVSLRRLSLTECEDVTILPVGLFTDECDQTAQGSSWQIPPDCMKSLESLHISFAGGSRDDEHSKMVFSSKKGLGRFENLKNLVIENCPTTLRAMISGGVSKIPPSSLLQLDLSSMDDEVLQFSHLSSLVELNLIRCRSLASVSLDRCTGLQNLTIRYCGLLAPLEGLRSCEALRHLSIQYCDTLPSLGAGGAPPRILETLSLESNGDLTCLDLRSCTALRELHVRRCAALASLEGLESLVALEKLHVEKSPGFAKSWLSAAAAVEVEGELRNYGHFLRTLQELDIDDVSILCGPICSQLTSLKTLIIHGAANGGDMMMMMDDALGDGHERALLLLTSLRELQLDGFKHLRSLPAELKSLASLETLSLVRCPCITSLPAEGLPASLKRIDIYSCSRELGSHCREVSTDQGLCLTLNGMKEV